MTDRPTDKAKDHFAYASQRAYEANRHFSTLQRGNNPPPPDDRQRGEMALANAVYYIAWGLKDLSAGLRATHILLDEVNRKLPKWATPAIAPRAGIRPDAPNRPDS
jgi:hypothetical protein